MYNRVFQHCLHNITLHCGEGEVSIFINVKKLSLSFLLLPPSPPPLPQDTLVISHTSINTGEPQLGGIKTPNTPKLTISNVTFVNFDLPRTSCLRACSHCKVRQGGFQVWFEGLSFLGGSHNRKMFFQWEHEVSDVMWFCIMGHVMSN